MLEYNERLISEESLTSAPVLPLSLISNYTEIDISYCDRKDYPFIGQQNMERMTYPDKLFYVVICINALDHTKKRWKQL